MATYDPWEEYGEAFRDKTRCAVVIYVADTYRYTGGPRQFKMHYTRQQCSRKPTHRNRCWQHKIESPHAPTTQGERGER